MAAYIGSFLQLLGSATMRHMLRRFWLSTSVVLALAATMSGAGEGTLSVVVMREPGSVLRHAATLIVDNHPPSLVSIDGKAEGHTPFVREVQPGQHRVVLTNGSGEQLYSDLVTVEAGVTTKVLGGVGPGWPTDAGAAYLSVDSVPWAHVTIDGRAAGSTPVHRVALEQGEHTIELKNEKQSIAVVTQVMVTPGRITRLRYEPKAAEPWKLWHTTTDSRR